MLVNPSLTAPPASARCDCLLHGEPGEAQAPASHSQVLPGTKQTGFLSLELPHSPWPGSFSAQYPELEQTKFQGCHATDETIPQAAPSEKIQFCARNTTPSAQQNPFQRTAFSNRESQPCFDEILPFHSIHLLRKRKSGTDLLTPTSTLFVITGTRWKSHWLGCLPLPNSHSAMTPANLCVSS